MPGVQQAGLDHPIEVEARSTQTPGLPSVQCFTQRSLAPVSRSLRSVWCIAMDTWSTSVVGRG